MIQDENDWGYEQLRQAQLDNKPESLLSTLLFAKPPKSLLKRRGKSGNPKPDNLKANKAKVDKAMELFRSVMGDKWTSTALVESRLGRGRSTALKPLRRWEALGLVECRQQVGIKTLNGKGLEWRWKC